jgi:ATP-dependent DNA helicase RecQ
VTELVLNTLLRTYTGLFADFVFINEPLMAHNCGLAENQVYESMIRLSRLHVLQYIPHKTSPYLLYTTSREEPRYLEIPRSVYEEQRERLSRRVKAMSQFTFATPANADCRVNIMLRYFGEQPVAPCGKCDICRSRLTKRSHTKTEVSILEESIAYMTSQQPRTIDYLASTSGQPIDRVVSTVRDMADRRLVTIDPEGIIHGRKK